MSVGRTDHDMFMVGSSSPHAPDCMPIESSGISTMLEPVYICVLRDKHDGCAVQHQVQSLYRSD